MEDFNELHRRDAEATRISYIKDEARKQADREREERRILRYERKRTRRTGTSTPVAPEPSIQNQGISNPHPRAVHPV